MIRSKRYSKVSYCGTIDSNYVKQKFVAFPVVYLVMAAISVMLSESTLADSESEKTTAQSLVTMF